MGNKNIITVQSGLSKKLALRKIIKMPEKDCMIWVNKING